MRLLMLIPHGDASGPMRRIAELLVEGLRGNGCDVSTAAWGGRAAGDSVVDRTSDRLRDLLRVRRAVAGADVDAVVVQTSHEWLPLLRELVLVAVLRPRARKIVLQFHGGHSGWLVGRGHELFKR